MTCHDCTAKLTSSYYRCTHCGATVCNECNMFNRGTCPECHTDGMTKQNAN